MFSHTAGKTSKGEEVKHTCLTILFLVLVSLSFGTQAQFSGDIPTIETPDGPGPGPDDGLGGNPQGCKICCKEAGENKIAQDFCTSRYPNCLCGLLDQPSGCFAVQAISQTRVGKSEGDSISQDIYALWDLLSSIDGSRELTRLFTTHGGDLIRMVQNDSAMAQAIAKFLQNNKTALRGILEGQGMVSENEYHSFAKLVSRIATVKTRDGKLSKRLKGTVVPRLSEEMVGMPYRKALECFVHSSCSVKD